MYGWTGKILHINLTAKKHFVEVPDVEIYQKYIGGRGLAGYYLKKFIKLPWDSEDMPLLFFTGPLVDTPSPTPGRMTVMSRSPLTGTICDSSAGGSLGVQIKKAGFDGIIITGRSENLCGIRILDSGVDKSYVGDSDVDIIDAQSMKGMDISRAINTLHVLGKGYSTALIGPAAENGVLFSNIAVDRNHFAGRGGLGLVMAAKNLKYIAVRGHGKTHIYDKNEVKNAREKIFRLSSASPILQGELGITNYGTGALYDLIHARRMMPTDNFRATQFADAPKLNAHHYKKQYKFKKKGCAGCHILCKRTGKNNEQIPEFETMSHFSALIGNSDIETVMEANRICGETGMDTISAGGTLACYREITGKDFSQEAVKKVLYDIAGGKNIIDNKSITAGKNIIDNKNITYSKGDNGNCTGAGHELKQGSYRYAKSKGKEDCSITVKKLELPAYDPRGAYGMALAYITSTRGGCHLRAYPITHEILRKPVATDRFSFSGKARIVKISEDLNAVIDSLTACKFLFFAAGLEEYAQVFSGVTGIQTTAQDLLRIGERIYYNERVMNAMNGFDIKDDDLPVRFFTEPGTSGEGILINPLNRDDFLKARCDYYKIRGLDKRGMPTKKKCGELGIGFPN